MIVPGADDAARLAWLGRHRLWPVAGFLASRGDVPPKLAALAAPLAESQLRDMRAQAEEERRVVSALSSSTEPPLVLKGALLARTVYPTPESRFRTDLDLLIREEAVAEIEEGLRSLGYERPEGAQTPMPVMQSQWSRRCDSRDFTIDLHWDLRNHPALQGCFSFQELFESRQPLPDLHENAVGMGPVHALLNASMHYFNDYTDERPQQGLLDKDLLWRSMSSDDQGEAMVLASDRGLAGLLAESLSRARSEFATPVESADIDHLRKIGEQQWATRLIRANRRRSTAYWFALRSEPGLGRKLTRIRLGLFPPASYMRRLYPESSRFGIAGLYFRRLIKSLI
jgi:hypothetical protein